MQVTRLAGATARMMTAFQQGLLTFQRMRTGGQQVVTVQHVEVRDGGQAIVAGKMQAGGGASEPEGGEAENDRSTPCTRLASPSR